MNLKLFSIVALSVIAATGISFTALYEAGEIGVSGERGVGSQYTPWDTERMVEHSDVIVRGSVISTETIVEKEIGYHDETNEIEQIKEMPYQLVTIQVSEVIKGDVVKTITVRDNMNAIVSEEGQRIKVVYENALTYNGGESGIFFIEDRDGQYVIDGYYQFLKNMGDDIFRSGFLADHTSIELQKSQIVQTVQRQN